MSILGANLKLYSPFQRQSMTYISGMIMMFFPLLNMHVFMDDLILKKQVQFYTFTMLLSFTFFFGHMVSKIQLDVLSKPFSFCLPTHNIMPRKVIFLIGLITTLVYTSLAFLLCYSIELNYSISIIPLLTLTSYFLGVCLSFYVSSNNRNSSLGWSICIIFLLLIFILFTFRNKFYISYNIVTMYCIPLLTLSCIFIMNTAWKILGDPELKRNYHENPLAVLEIAYDKGFTDQLKVNRGVISQKIIDSINSENKITLFFLKRMRVNNYFSLKHSLLGKLYYLFFRHFTFSGKEPYPRLILASLILFISGYFGSSNTHKYYDLVIDPVQLLAILPMCFILSSIFAPSSHNIMLPEGRARQYRISFKVWLLKYFINLLIIIIVIAASWFIQDYMPEFDFLGYHITYNTPSMYPVVWALIIIPSIDLIYFYYYFPDRLIITVILTFILITLFSISHAVKIVFIHNLFAIIMIVFPNGLFDSLLKQYWLKNDHS
jgi:hypothetical protein